MKITDEVYNAMLEHAFSAVVPDVWEGIYTGADVDEYITFAYEGRGMLYANNKPKYLVRGTTVVLWVRNGVDAFLHKQKLKKAIISLGGTIPKEQVATDNAWQQYIFEFEHGCDYPYEEDS